MTSWPGGRTAALEVPHTLAGVERAFRRAVRERVVSRLVVLAFFVLSIAAVARWSIARPIRALIQGARAVGRGDLSQRIDVTRRDEVGQLAEEFNRMAENLQAAHREIVRQAEERLRLQQEVQQAQKLGYIGMLAAEVAHEVGTPLNVISGRAEVLARAIPTDSPERRHLVLIVQKALEDTRLRKENVLLRGEIERRYQLGSLIGASKAMGEVFDLIERVAATDINVLITGESGTGKELAAKAIHYNSARRRGRFVPINCAGIPETLLESELFGYVRGAFTGATATRKGLLEEAHGGTLFLDEIAEMPMLLQAKLLRVLEDKEVRPLGSNRGTVIDFRVIAGTNKDPRAQVKGGGFREDLFFRLNVAGIDLPPLRERDEDLRLLAKQFIAKHAGAQGRPVSGISREALALLERCPWPRPSGAVHRAHPRRVRRGPRQGGPHPRRPPPHAHPAEEARRGIEGRGEVQPPRVGLTLTPCPFPRQSVLARIPQKSQSIARIRNGPLTTGPRADRAIRPLSCCPELP
jgi:transcriptional regulator with AAA-type ATPase domain